VETSKPSSTKIFWIMGVPQKGLSRDIWRMSRLSGASIFGLPGRGALQDFLFQYSLKPILCHRTTVSGLTTDSGDFHLGHSLDIHTQKILSVFFRLGRGLFLDNVVTCCLRHKFSAAMSALLFKKARSMLKTMAQRDINFYFHGLDDWGKLRMEFTIGTGKSLCCQVKPALGDFRSL